MPSATPPSADRGWVWAGRIMVLGASLIWLTRWFLFPLFLDAAYHLLTMQGFLRAGGIVAHDYWEFVPAGRPHLYPPLLHVFMAGWGAAGASPLLIARVLSWSGLPVLLVSLWCVGRRLMGARTAVWWVVAALVPYAWVVETAITMPATYALALILWAWLAIERARWIAATLLLAALWYLHLGVPWLAYLSFGLYSCWRPELRRRLWIVLGVALVLGSPWLWHLAQHRDIFTAVSRRENRFVEWAPLFLVAAAYGLRLAWRARDHRRFLIALGLGFVPMAWTYTYRWTNAQGLLPLVLAAGCAYDAISARLIGWAQRALPRLRPAALVALMIGALWLITPTVLRMPQPYRVMVSRPFWAHLLPSYPQLAAPNEVALYTQWTAELADWVQAHTDARAVLWSDLPYSGGFIAALTGRVLANGVFYETQPAHAPDVLSSADTLIWFKNAATPERVPTEPLAAKGFSLQLETPVARIYQKPGPSAAWSVAPVACPLVLAWLVIVAGGAAVVWDMRRGSA